MKYYHNSEMKKIIKFGCVGVINTAVDFLVFFSLTTFLHLNVYSSQFCSYIIATFNSYFLNRTFTFKSKDEFVGAELLRFILVNLTSLLLSLGLMYIFNDILQMDKMICKILITPFTFAVNYLGNRLWVFKKH